MLHCLHSVLWLEFSVWGSSDKLSAAPRPKKNYLASSVHKILHHFSLGQSMCSLANCNLFIFFNNGTLRGLLADSLASHMCLLIVTVLTGNFRLSLITLELIIGRVFAILAILRSIRTVVFRFLPHLSGFGCHFKAFDIILAEQPIISALCFPSLINFLIKVRYSFEQCLGWPFYSDFQRETHSTTFAAFVLNKGHCLTPVFSQNDLTLIKLHTAIIWTRPFQLMIQLHIINSMHVMTVGSVGFLLLYHTY